MPLTRVTPAVVDRVFELAEQEGLARITFSHPGYLAPDRALGYGDMLPGDIRRSLDAIITHVIDFHAHGLPTEVITEGSHLDGIYLYIALRRRDPDRAREVLQRLIQHQRAP